jgi:hypothetical protein
MADTESCELAQDFITHLTHISDERLTSLDLQHMGQASQNASEIKRWLSARVDEICTQRQAERAASTQTARDGHFQAAKALKHEVTHVLYALLEEWSEHRVIMQITRVIRQLPRSRRPTSKPVVSLTSPQRVPQRPIPAESSQLRGLVAQHVADLLADPNDFALGGWFRERMESNAIRRHQSKEDRYLWHEYFNTYGCLDCHANDAVYGGCGFCQRCYTRIRYRVSSLRQHHKEHAQSLGL